MKKFKIVKLGREDVELLVSLAKSTDLELMGTKSECYSSLIYRHEWLDGLEKGIHVWGIIEDDQLVATGSLNFYLNRKDTNYENADEALLVSDIVHPDYRRKGYHRILISTRIMFCLRNKIYSIKSIVRTDNMPCIKNFKRMKFSEKLCDYHREPVFLFSYKNYLMLYFFKAYNYVINFFKT